MRIIEPCLNMIYVTYYLLANASEEGLKELTHEISVLRKIQALVSFFTYFVLQQNLVIIIFYNQDDKSASILALVGVTEEPDPLCLLMEYLPYKTLTSFLSSLLKGPIPDLYKEHVSSSQRGTYTEAQISDDLMSILIQIVQGEVNSLHGFKLLEIYL